MTSHCTRTNEKYSLFTALKTTVECILSKQASNVWNVYGGFQSTLQHVDDILKHGYKPISKKNVVGDYWPLVKNLQWLDTTQLFMQYKPVNFTDLCENKSQGRKWVEHNLREFTLQNQLKILLDDSQLVEEYYEEWSFLLDDRFLKEFFTCIKALETNNSSLLASISSQMFGMDNMNLQEKTPKKTHLDATQNYMSHKSDSEKECNENQTEKNLSNYEKQQNSKNFDDHFSSQYNENASSPKMPLPDLIPSIEKNRKQNVSKSSLNKGLEQSISKSSFNEGLKLYKCQESYRDDDCVSLDSRKPYSDSSVLNLDTSYEYETDSQYSGKSGRSQTPSLMEFLKNQDLATCADIDKENAHFIFADMMISTIEKMKSQILMQTELKRILLNKVPDANSNFNLSGTTSSQNLLQVNDEKIESSSHYSDEPSTSYSEISESKAAPSPKSFVESSVSTHKRNLSTAESVAINLLERLSNENSLIDKNKFIISEDEVPQKLLPIPSSVVIDPDETCIETLWSKNFDQSEVRIRGNHKWAPPRRQIIVHSMRRENVKVCMKKQNDRCAGCGTVISESTYKRMRYCEYLGKYFCSCCHENKTSYIPSKILQNYDFHQYRVSNFSFDLLETMFEEPLYNLQDINPKLYRKNKNMSRIKEMRERLCSMNLYIKNCRLAKEVPQKQDNQEQSDEIECSVAYIFSQFPSHMLNFNLDVFSLSDLVGIRNGNLCVGIQLAHKVGEQHIETCQLCIMRGHVCEICGNYDVIFPHQPTTRWCTTCLSCYHGDCWKGDSTCLKCTRMKERTTINALSR